MNETMVLLDGVSKRFRLGESHDSLRALFWNGVRRLGRSQSPAAEPRCFWALRDVSLQVRRGEAMGIIGPNGAGKSTALRLLAGILRPDAGRVHVTGRLAALIEIGAGFHGDLSGRENVFLHGAILGMKREEIRRKLDAIVAFAGIERFLDTPVKRYSSGMYARLGFSIAAHVEPDVLLVDEVLAVGDAVFRLRCLDRMRGLLQGGTALVFVSHHLEQVQQICTRTTVLEEGRACFAGDTHDAVKHYLAAMSRSFVERPPDLMRGKADKPDIGLLDLRFLDENGGELASPNPRDPVRLVIHFRAARAIPRLVVECNLRDGDRDHLLSVNSGRDDVYFDVQPGTHRVELVLSMIPIAGGQYFWNVRMWDFDSGAALVDTPFQYPLLIDDTGCRSGVLSVEHRWRSEALERTFLPGRDAAASGGGAIHDDRCRHLLRAGVG